MGWEWTTLKYDGLKYDSFTPSTEEYAKIYLANKVNVPKRPPLKKVAQMARGHTIEDCQVLKNNVVHFVRRGELDKYKDRGKIKAENEARPLMVIGKTRGRRKENSISMLFS